MYGRRRPFIYIVQIMFHKKPISMKKLFLLVAIAFSVIVLSCSTDEPEQSAETMSQKSGSSLRSPDEVADFIQSLVDQIDGQDESRGGSRRIVGNVQPVSVKNFMSRTYQYTLDTLFYIVNFADSAGFAFAGALPESEPVFAIIDDGNLDWKDLENPETQLKYFQTCNFLELTIYSSGLGYFSSDPIETEIKNWYVYSAKAPILKTKWRQEEVYGSLCSNNKTGCVPLALAQMQSYYQTIDSVPDISDEEPGTRIDWTNIIEQCNKNNGKLKSNTEAGRQIAKLCRWIGHSIGAKYGEYTSCNSSKALKFMSDKCGLSTTGLKKYDESLIKSSIDNGVPAYGRGNTSQKKFLFFTIGYNGGHAWVYDGYAICRNKYDLDAGKKTLFHCNWGWGGGSNGYYLSKVFDTNAIEIPESEIQEDMLSSRGEYYYRYNLECATLWKKEYDN